MNAEEKARELAKELRNLDATDGLYDDAGIPELTTYIEKAEALKDIASNLGRGSIHPSPCDALRVRATEALTQPKA
jgi:hypothetical protein